jgi:hypothetical protein
MLAEVEIALDEDRLQPSNACLLESPKTYLEENELARDLGKT